MDQFQNTKPQLERVASLVVAARFPSVQYATHTLATLRRPHTVARSVFGVAGGTLR